MSAIHLFLKGGLAARAASVVNRYLPLTTDYLLATYRSPLTTDYLLLGRYDGREAFPPTTYYLLPTTYYSLPTTQLTVPVTTGARPSAQLSSTRSPRPYSAGECMRRLGNSSSA